MRSTEPRFVGPRPADPLRFKAPPIKILLTLVNGFKYILLKGLAHPSVDRVLNLRHCMAFFPLSNGGAALTLAWLRFLGLMASMVVLIDSCRRRMRPIQLHLLSYFRPSRHSIHTLVPTKPWLIPHLFANLFASFLQPLMSLIPGSNSAKRN